GLGAGVHPPRGPDHHRRHRGAAARWRHAVGRVPERDHPAIPGGRGQRRTVPVTCSGAPRRSRQSMTAEPGVLVVAHRGNCSAAPGNTMPAVEGAWRVGADLVEVDVRMSADDVPVVIHDETVDATTTGSGPVASMTGAQARALD